MATTAPTPETTAVNDAAPEKTGFRKQAEDKFGAAQESVGKAYKSTRDTAKKQPVAATAIVTGATAAIAGAAYGATRFFRKSDATKKSAPPKVKPSAD